MATVPEDILRQIVHFDYYDPFQVLGMHEIDLSGKTAVAARVLNPAAEKIWLIDTKTQKETEMEKIWNEGVFECVFKTRTKAFPYEIKVQYYGGFQQTMRDPYSFLPVLSDLDLHLFSEGTHQDAYKKLGAHIMEIDGVKGVHFAVWAPNAKAVAVVGGFNAWDARRHQMRVLGSSGVWEIFIPEIGEGEVYKYILKTHHGASIEKADPYGYYSELRPRTGSVVWDINKHKWKDKKWMDKRKKQNSLEMPFSCYEVHLGSWKKGGDGGFIDYRQAAHDLVDYCKYMNYTHVELMPVSEYPFDGSWGYQVTGYFAVTSRFGNPDDFMYFVDHLHQNNIGIILDWVPGHFPKDAHGLARFDGTPLYEHSDPRKGEHMDWGTYIFNYGRNEVKNFLISNAFFWLDYYHIDGLRVDAVASMLYLDYSREAGEWVPNEYGGRENLEAIAFMQQMHQSLYERFPGAVTIAEESTAFGGVSRPVYSGGLGFAFKWNMGWMNDTLEYIQLDPIYRKYHQGEITFSLIYAFTENFVLVLSHDEVVHGKGSVLNKMPGDDWQKFANVRALYLYMWTHPGKKLLFQGQDFGQWDEWNHENSIDWHLTDYERHRGLMNLVRDLNRIYQDEPALHEIDFTPEGFEWLEHSDADNCVLSFVRRAKDGSFLIVAVNFTPVPRENYRIGVFYEGFYKEILNSDAGAYWGANIGNNGGVHSDGMGWQGKPYSLNITIPPLGGVIFKLEK